MCTKFSREKKQWTKKSEKNYFAQSLSAKKKCTKKSAKKIVQKIHPRKKQCTKKKNP